VGNDKTHSIIVIIQTGWNNPGLLENLVRQGDFGKNCPLNGLLILVLALWNRAQLYFPEPNLQELLGDGEADYIPDFSVGQYKE